MKNFKKMISAVALFAACVSSPAMAAGDFKMGGKEYTWYNLGKMYGSVPVCNNKIALDKPNDNALSFGFMGNSLLITTAIDANIGGIDKTRPKSPVSGKEAGKMFEKGMNDIVNQVKSTTDHNKLIELCVPLNESLNEFETALKSPNKTKWNLAPGVSNALFDHQKYYMDWSLNHACTGKEVNKKKIYQYVNGQSQSLRLPPVLVEVFEDGSGGEYADFIDYSMRNYSKERVAFYKEKGDKQRLENLCKGGEKGVNNAIEVDRVKRGWSAFIGDLFKAP